MTRYFIPLKRGSSFFGVGAAFSSAAGFSGGFLSRSLFCADKEHENERAATNARFEINLD